MLSHRNHGVPFARPLSSRDDVALQPEGGREISGADYALGFVDVIEQGKHHRAHINLGY